MNEVALFVGYMFLILGGSILFGFLLVALGQLLCEAWIAVRKKCRMIREEEALILDYKKNREKFMEWREGEENMWKGRLENYG